MHALNNGFAKVCGFNTATARCRTAKQFAKFLEPDRHRLSSVQSNKKVS